MHWNDARINAVRESGMCGPVLRCTPEHSHAATGDIDRVAPKRPNNRLLCIGEDVRKLKC
jgi:hypothetical protein